MKNSSIIINVIFGFAIALLFILQAGKKDSQKEVQIETKNPVQIAVQDSSGNVIMKTFPVGYVILDSLMQNYAYYKKIETQYQALVKSEEQAIQNKMQALYTEGGKLQQQYQQQLITSQNAQIKQQELAQREQELVQLQQTKGQELAVKEQALMKELLDSVNATIDIYNADGRFEIILNNAFGSNILHANEQLNITGDILTIMNQRYSAKK